MLNWLKIGVGLTIAASLLPKLLGIPPPSTSGFLQDIGNALRNLGHVSVTTLALPAGTVARLVVLKMVAPRVSGPLIAVIAGIGLVVFAGLDEHGVAVIAEVPRGLPVPHLPPLHHLGDLTRTPWPSPCWPSSRASRSPEPPRETTDRQRPGAWWRSARPPSPVASS